MSDSFWKKEISLGRKKGQPEGEVQPDAVAEPVAPQPAPPVTGVEPKQSMWKKELSFGRKPKAETAAPPPVAPPVADAEPKQSMWKKDISLGRKPKDETPELPAVAAEAKQSMWKKELSFGRKKQDKELDRMVEEAAQAVSPEFAPPSFAPAPPQAEVPPTAVAEAVVAAMPEPAAPESLAPEPLVPEPQLQAVPSFEPDPPFAAAPLYVAPDPPALVPEPADAGPFELAAVESLPATLEPWEPVALEAVPPEPEPVSVEPFPLEAVPSALAPYEPAPFEPVPYEPQPIEPMPAAVAPEQPFDPPVDPVPAEPAPLSALLPAIVAASAEEPVAFEPTPIEPTPVQPVSFEPVEVPPAELPPVELPPVELPPDALVPAAFTPVEPEHFAPLGAEADPWLGSPELPPDAVEPAVVAAAAEPVAAVVHPPVPAAELAPVVAAKGPFWKKELSFSRKKKPDFTAVEAAVAAVAVAGGAPVKKSPWWKKEIGGKKKAPEEVSSGFEEFESPKKPIWKKDLSFSRKPKAAPAAVDAAVVAAAVADATAVAKTPWYKKELGGKKMQKDAPADAAVSSDAAVGSPAEAKTAFWKKGLTMPTLSRSGGRTSGGSGSKSKGSKNLVGLKIGASQLAAARVSNNGVAALEQVARTALPMGIVVGGELRDPDALSDALKAFFAKNKLPRKGVRLGIANNRIGVRVIDIAGVDEEKQLANAIHFRAQEALPIPLDEAVLDYHVLDESFDPEGNSVKRVLLVVAYKELVERYVGACRKAGLTIAGVDLEAFALLRSLSPPADRGTSALVAVAIGFDRSTFAVSDGRFCEFTRVLEWGGQSLNVALARAFNSEPSAVETMKRGLSLDGSTAPEGVSAESNAAAVDVVRKQMQSFARELVSSLQFYQNQPGSLGIGEIAITGGTAQMPGIAEELERLIGVPVRVGNPLARLKVSKRVSMTDDVGSYAVAIGLGIED
jgi:type IV pilus assembly protein PilM